MGAYAQVPVDGIDLIYIGVDGMPMENWCEMAGGCLNGGTCYNQCDTFWCDCGELAALSTDHVGKRCETDSGKSGKSAY